MVAGKSKKYALIAALFFSVAICQAQAVPKGTELQELVKIASLYKDLPYLSFNLRYTYADSLTWTDLTDSLSANCKLSYGRSHISNDDFEILNGSNYIVYLDMEDSLMIISRKTVSENVFQMPLLDSTFREGHVADMNVTEINDSTWKFSVSFLPDSYYSFFEMDYNPMTSLVRYVNYHAKNFPGGHGIPADHIICAYVYMTGYSASDGDQSIFNEHRYFYLLNGQKYVQPEFEGFEIVQ